MHRWQRKQALWWLGLWMLWGCLPVEGQTLTSTQLQTLKTFIQNDATLNAQPNTSDGNFAIAQALNAVAAPNFWVYRTTVSIREIGDAFHGTELAGLTTGNQTRLQTIAQFSPDGINASLANRRAFFDDVFSGAGGVTTRANLAVLWRRQATVIEQLFATGTGSTASPATMSVEGAVTYPVVESARNLP